MESPTTVTTALYTLAGVPMLLFVKPIGKSGLKVQTVSTALYTLVGRPMLQFVKPIDKSCLKVQRQSQKHYTPWSEALCFSLSNL